VLDYLIEEVFKRQSTEIQDFLLKHPFLTGCADPCVMPCGPDGQRDLLEHLEHANLFIVPLDQSCTWYRYHACS